MAWTDDAREAAARARQGSGSKEPAHQSRISQLVTAFGKSESGAGKIPKLLEDFEARSKDPGHASQALSHLGAAISEGKIDVQALVHFAHFLGVLATIAVASELIQWVAHVV